ncbi:hypothetical protein L9F63_010191, partial [Diploptera punctata]
SWTRISLKGCRFLHFPTVDGCNEFAKGTKSYFSYCVYTSLRFSRPLSRLSASNGAIFLHNVHSLMVNLIIEKCSQHRVYYLNCVRLAFRL